MSSMNSIRHDIGISSFFICGMLAVVSTVFNSPKCRREYIAKQRVTVSTFVLFPWPLLQCSDNSNGAKIHQEMSPGHAVSLQLDKETGDGAAVASSRQLSEETQVAIVSSNVGGGKIRP